MHLALFCQVNPLYSYGWLYNDVAFGITLGSTSCGPNASCIQTLLKPTICLLLMTRCTSVDWEGWKQGPHAIAAPDARFRSRQLVWIFQLRTPSFVQLLLTGTLFPCFLHGYRDDSVAVFAGHLSNQFTLEYNNYNGSRKFIFFS